MKTEDVLMEFAKAVLGQPTFPENLAVKGPSVEVTETLGKVNRNIFYTAKNYKHPFSESVIFVIETIFRACVEGELSSISPALEVGRFIEFVRRCFPSTKGPLSSFEVASFPEDERCEEVRKILIKCVEEMLDLLAVDLNGVDINEHAIVSLVDSHAYKAAGVRRKPIPAIDDESHRYASTFNKQLHLDRMRKEDVTLKQIYVEPEFCYCPNDTDEIKVEAPLKDLVEAFVHDRLSDHGDFAPRANVLTLLGQPGVGKTSFLSFLCDSHYHGGFCRDVDAFYCIPLRELANTEFAVTDRPLKYICETLRIDPAGRERKLIILDGLDELCLILSAGASINDFFFKLLEDAEKCDDLKVLVTSRLNYVSAVFNKDLPSAVFELKEFSWAQSREMIDKIEKARSDEIPESLVRSLKERYEDYPFLTVPLLLYMIVALGIDVGEVSEIGQLYDRIFDEMSCRKYGLEGKQEFSTVIDPREIARSLAVEMRRRSQKYLDASEAKMVLESIDAKLESKEQRDAVEKGYGLTFFYEKRHPDVFAPEFIHLTFVEFLSAEQIYLILSESISMNKASEFDEGLIYWWEQMDYLLSWSDLSEQTVDFFRYKVESNKDDLPINELVDALLDWLFTAYLSKGMVYKAGSEDMEDCVVKASRLFLNYWRLVKCLKPSESVLSTRDVFERQEFVNFLRTASRNTEVSFSLNYEDLSSCDLQDLDLSDCYLIGANFDDSDLSYSRFVEANLTQAHLSSCKLHMVDFEGAKMHGANISFSECETASFRNICCSFRDVNTGAEIIGPPIEGDPDTDTGQRVSVFVGRAGSPGAGLVVDRRQLAILDLKEELCLVVGSEGDKGYVE